MEKELNIESIQEEKNEERKLKKIEERWLQTIGGDPNEILISSNGQKYSKQPIVGYTEKKYYLHSGPGWDWYSAYLKDIVGMTNRTKESYFDLMIGDPGRVLLDEQLYDLVLIDQKDNPEDI